MASWKFMSALAGIASLFALRAEAEMTAGRPGHGFIGYGITMYDPPCAYACNAAISAPLNCTGAEMGDMDMTNMSMEKRMNMGGDSVPSDLPSGDGWMVMAPTPACKANNDFFLQTLAYCIKERCSDLTVAALEKYWINNVAGTQLNQPLPKKSYGEALTAAVISKPTRELNNTIHLNHTALVTDDQWYPTYSADVNFESVEITHERYGLVIFLTGAIMPISLSLLRFLPWPPSLESRFKAYLIDPPLWGSQHAAPVWGFGVMPTRGQGLFIGYLWLINIVLSAAGYWIVWPMVWWDTQSGEVITYIANRVGVLSFANLPLVFLYAGRNNVLLWLTNWSHSTFLLIHRWIAFICMFQAVLHSVLYLYVYVNTPGDNHSTESKLPYWYWGVIGTLSLSTLIPASILPLRQRVYETFLASHIVLSTLALIGCFLHIYFRFVQQWGYETWLYITTAIWVFDRLVRVIRTIRGGIRRAVVTSIDDDYLRVDILGITATGHVYLHFPTLSTWRIWENHPFSVAGITTRSLESAISMTSSATTNPAGATEEEKNPKGDASALGKPSDSPSLSSAGMHDGIREVMTTFFVRKHAGLTSLLNAKCNASRGTPVLVEGSYGPGVTFLQDGHNFPTHAFPNILCIAGGVGITAILPVLDHVSRIGPALGSNRLYWGVRSLPLVHAVECMMGVKSAGAADVRQWGGTAVTMAVGERFRLTDVLVSELRCQNGGTTVVVCGPPGMADEVRCIVSGLGRHGVLVKLVVESFIW